MPLQIEERDLLLLSEIGELGLLDIDTITVRYWPEAKSARACQKRLKLLVDHGLLKPIRLEVTLRAKPNSRQTIEPTSGRKKKVGGRLPTIFVLTEHGGDFVEASGRPRPRRISRSDPKPLTLWHRLEVVLVRLAVDDACRRHSIPVPTWIMEQDTYPGASLSEPLSKRLILHELFPAGSRRPDASCLLRLPSASPNRKFDELIVYLELDRSTNSNDREAAKLPGYHALIKEKAFRRHWPDVEQPTVRLFYVCKSSERIDNLIRAFAGEAVSEYIRFALREDIEPDRALTDAIWQTTGGELRAILAAKA